MDQSPAVVVGIDGSRWSVDAAMWAAEEAAHRGVPLRLIYVLEPRGDSESEQRRLADDRACAHVSVRRVIDAIESAGRPVRIDWQIAEGSPSQVLQEASRSAELVCIGSLGIAHATGRRMGSTGQGLVTSAQCPVAIVRSNRHRGGVVVDIDETDEIADSTGILDMAIREAQWRDAPLTALLAGSRSAGELPNPDNRHLQARLRRRIAHHRARPHNLQFDAVVNDGGSMNYLDHHADSIQLLVVGHRRAAEMGELIGRVPAAPGPACGDYTVLIGGRHRRH